MFILRYMANTQGSCSGFIFGLHVFALVVCVWGGGGVRIGCARVFDTNMLVFAKGVICKALMQMGLRCSRI